MVLWFCAFCVFYFPQPSRGDNIAWNDTLDSYLAEQQLPWRELSGPRVVLRVQMLRFDLAIAKEEMTYTIPGLGTSRAATGRVVILKKDGDTWRVVRVLSAASR